MLRRTRNSLQRRRRGGRDTRPKYAENPRKTAKNGHSGGFNNKRGPLASSRKSQQQTKEESSEAPEDSVADGATNGKWGERANEALERANSTRKTGTSAQIGEDRDVRGPCEACVEHRRISENLVSSKVTFLKKTSDHVTLIVPQRFAGFQASKKFIEAK